MAEHEFPIDRTAILTFAAALGESNPIYWDRDYAKSTALGDVVAPPTFGISSAHWNPDYGLRGTRKIPAPRAAAKAALQAPASEKPATDPSAPKRSRDATGGGNLARVLHAEQRFEYKKPLQPGMRLTVSTRPGKSWEKEGKRGGTLSFSESIAEYRDESGEIVLVATSVGVVTGKAVEQS